MIPLIYTFDWFKRDKNFTTSNKEIKLNWEAGLNDKFSAFLYNNSQVNMLLKKKGELIDELCGIGLNFGINKRRILINDKSSNSMTNNKSIIISTKFNDAIKNNYDKLDLIIGLFCHECAHCLYSDFKFINSSNRIIKWFQNVIEDELIESKLGQSYPGYINFISKVKYYYFDVLKDEILNNKKERNDLDKIMKIFLLVVRYPKYLNEIPENELAEYADLFDKIYDILKSNMCLNPDRNNMCTSWSFNAAKQIYNIIKEYILAKYPEKKEEKNKKNNKKSKKNNSEKGLGSEENEDEFNDSSDESSDDTSEGGSDNEDNDTSDEMEDYSEDKDDDLSEEDFDREDGYSEDELFNDEDEDSSDKTSVETDSDYDSEDELFNDEDEDSDSENESGSKKTSFEEMEDEVNNNEDSVENLYDKATENVESSSEDNTDFFSSSLDIEKKADEIQKDWEIEERESLDINIKENESLTEISNYNEVYNEIRPYITFAKQMVIQNEASDVLKPERFRRNGMLDTRKIAEAYMGCNNVFTQNIQRKKRNQNSKYALVIMLDESGSMGYHKIFNFTTQMAVLIYETIKLYKDMEIYIYGHGDFVVPYITKNKIEKEALAVRKIQGDQDEPTSYKVIIEDVKKQTNLPIIAINITDSFYCYQPERIKEVVREYKKQHVDINLICCSEETYAGSSVYDMNNQIYGANNWISIDQLGNKFKSSMKILGEIIKRNYNSKN